MTEVLTLDGLAVSFGKIPVLDGISLQLAQGEIFGLVGESGSGKSTVANAIMGLLPGTARVSGSVRLNGRELVGLGEDALGAMRGREMSMIFQDASASLDPTCPVGEQIAETIRAHAAVGRRAARNRAAALMAEVGIPEAERRYSDPPHRFSGGQRQRVMIAAALANNPKLLIADEPTTALDVTIQAQVLKLIDAMRREHSTTVLLITHDFGVVAQICDRVGVMYRGALVEVADVGRLFSAPRHSYSRALMAANPAWAPRGTRLPVIPKEWNVETLAELEAGAEAEPGL
jgi:ABC-type dipeptide/oligopeptide/nickel transport system ATPase component